MLAAVACGALITGGCGDGEDRPGQVTADAPGGATGPAGSSPVGTDSNGMLGGQGQHGADSAAFSQAQADTTVRVQLRDFGFFGIPERVKGPKIFFSAENAGPAAHELEITDAGGKVVAAIEPFAAGQSKTLAAELQPGNYTVQCLVNQGGRTHVDFGMVTTFTVE